MEEKRFILRCSLFDKETGKTTPHEEIITGINGTFAVNTYEKKLKAEGRYKLGLDYTYFEITKK